MRSMTAELELVRAAARQLALVICLLAPSAPGQPGETPAPHRGAPPRAAPAAGAGVEPTKTSVKDLDLRWMGIPAGTFRMGCSSSDRDCRGDEKPSHTVRITKSFRMMATEV